MANTRSAKIADRKATRRTEVNKARKSRIKTFIKKVEEAVAKNDKPAAAAAFINAQSEIFRGVTKNLIKKNAAARKVSRLNAQIKKIA
jgi:small subunit ribosomal protein S20